MKTYAELKKENENYKKIIQSQRATIDKFKQDIANYDKWITENYNEIVKVCKVVNV